MSTPPFLASSFRFLTTTGITDVATMITDFRSETVTNGSPAWTEPTSQHFKSPTDAFGRFFTVILTRTTALRLEWTITDQNGVTICDREIDISGGGNSVDYATGQYHAWVVSQVATPEVAFAGILDLTPAAQNSHSNWVYGNGYRNSGGAIDGAGSTTGQVFMLDTGTATQNQRPRAWGQSQANASIGLIDGAGNLQAFPSDFFAVMGGVARWVGRPYQIYMLDSSVPGATIKVLSTDSAGATTGTFKTIGGLGVINNTRWAVRTG